MAALFISKRNWVSIITNRSVQSGVSAVSIGNLRLSGVVVTDPLGQTRQLPYVTATFNRQSAPSIGTVRLASVATDPITRLLTLSLQTEANPNNLPTTVWFEYGLTTSYGLATTPQSLSPGGMPVQVSAQAPSLMPGSSYHFRATATNSVGASFSPDFFCPLGVSILFPPANTVVNRCATA